MKLPFITFSLTAALVAPAAPALAAATFRPLDSFFSTGNQLEINLEARSGRARIGPYDVEGAMTYHVCQKLPHGQKHCTTRAYAGPRLQIEPGQDLVVHFTNRLASANSGPLTHCMDVASTEGLTNIHTHGLLVSPTKGDATTPYGDYVVDCTKPVSNTQAASGTVVGTAMNYRIHIPGTPGGAPSNSQHPSGVDWVHPHVHGAAKAQMSAGLAGMLTVGRLADYVCLEAKPDGSCNKPFHTGDAVVRNMLLKDTQIVRTKMNSGKWGGWRMYADEFPGFCGDNGELASNAGECAFYIPEDQTDLPDGLKTVASAGGQGKWVFTVNGVEMPHWNVEPGSAEIWRLQNASANVSYDLSITTAAGELPFQVLTMDGAGLGAQSDAATPATFSAATKLQQHLILMPGARAELYVAHRDIAACTAANFDMAAAGCKVTVPTAAVAATLRTSGFDTGGDNWPKLALAVPTFQASNTAVATLYSPSTRSLARPDLRRMFAARSLAPPGPPQPLSADPSLGCINNHAYRLKDGERRRVYFGIDENDRFMLGTTIVAADGKEYVDTPTGLSAVDYAAPASDSTRVSLQEFPMGTSLKDVLCVPQAGSDPANPGSYGERWDLVNVSVEVHNFHIHQTRFTVVSEPDDPAQPNGPVHPFMSAQPLDRQNLLNKVLFASGNQIAATHDVIVVPRGGDGCGPGVLQAVPNADANRHWLIPNGHGGKQECLGPLSSNLVDWDQSGMISVYLPFDRKEQQGTFVFHCHILEHEDKGMMAAITVLKPGAFP